jgi:hypothetical protein
MIKEGRRQQDSRDFPRRDHEALPKACPQGMLLFEIRIGIRSRAVHPANLSRPRTRDKASKDNTPGALNRDEILLNRYRALAV